MTGGILMDIDARKIKRLNLLHHSIDTSYPHLKDVIYSDDEVETFIALKSLLDFIFSADEMHFKRENYFHRRNNDKKEGI